MQSAEDLLQKNLQNIPYQHAWVRWEAVLAMICQAMLTQCWLMLCQPLSAHVFDSLIPEEARPHREILGRAVVPMCLRCFVQSLQIT